jgi:hypothetical protein
MATNTYVALDKVTLSSTSALITLSSIPSTYTDLVLVANFGATASGDYRIRVNSNTSTTDYSYTYVAGNGTAASSSRNPNTDRFSSGFLVGTDTGSNTVVHQFQNYSNTTTYKTVVYRSNMPSGEVSAAAGLWRSTAAISSIYIYPTGGSFAIGSTFSLYGIRAEGVSPAAKATGGTIYSDSTYYYHVFDSTGTFTPLQSLSVDILQVAGGGGGGGVFTSVPYCAGGGGGAGGLSYYASQGVTATGYAVTVGSGGTGGAGGTAGLTGAKGTLSQFAAVASSSGGGGGMGRLASANTDSNGGSGGGGATDTGFTPEYGVAVSGQGNNGGQPYPSGTSRGGGGGGGAGAAGGRPNGNTQGGAGGNGTTTYSAWSAATGIGENISGTYYIAGGGGGGGGAQSTPGIAGYGGGAVGNGTSGNGLSNTGGGGGGATQNTAGGNGGSGFVIVRYAKA